MESTTPRPSLDLVRSATDEHVLRALMRHRRLTRAELAGAAGISKPTAGESVRRLVERGVVADTGERTPGGRGRGRVGSYYALAATVGTALAVAIAPEGVVAECVDVYGDTVGRARRSVRRPAEATQGDGVTASENGAARAAEVTQTLRAVVAAALDGAPSRPRVAVVSAADPVDRATGRLVQLPDAPFLVGELDPVAVLAGHVEGPVIVDNDVNWAARAERDGSDLSDFAYLHLGEGLGCAVVSDGVVQRGRNGLAGEIAYLLTTGPDGRAMRFIDVFADLGLRLPGSSAIDTGRLLAALHESSAGERATTSASPRDAPGSAEPAASPHPGAASPGSAAAAVETVLRDALTGVVTAVVALADPGCVVVGGAWGAALLSAARPGPGTLPWPVPVRAARQREEPAFSAARADALARLRAEVTAGL